MAEQQDPWAVVGTAPLASDKSDDGSPPADPWAVVSHEPTSAPRPRTGDAAADFRSGMAERFSRASERTPEIEGVGPAWRAMQQDWEQMQGPKPESFWAAQKAGFDRLLATGHLAVDAFNMAMALPSVATTKAVAEPISWATGHMVSPEEVNTALTALQPGKGGLSSAPWRTGQSGRAPGPSLLTQISQIPGNLMPATETAQQRLATERVRGAAASPEQMEAAVQEGRELVPGSKPTLAQVAQDPGIDELERAMRLKNPVVRGEGGQPLTFPGRAAEQNAARVEAIRSITPDSADPADVSRFVAQRLRQIDAMSDEALTAAKQRASQATEGLGQAIGEAHQAAAAGAEQAAAAARERLSGEVESLGGTERATDYGRQLREDELQPARQALKRQADALWNPLRERNPVLDASPAAQGARAIEAGIPEGATQSGAERTLFTRAKGLDRPVPWDQFQQLRSELGEAISDEMATNGRSPAWRRMVLLRGEMNKALTSAAERTAMADAAGAGPTKQAPPSLFDRLQQEAHDYIRAARTDRIPRSAGDLGGEGAGSARPGVQDLPPAEVAPGSEARQPPGGSAGTPSLPENAQPLRPTWSEEDAAQYQKARSLTARLKQLFSRGAVGQALKEAGWGDYKLADEQVVRRFLNTGPRKAQDLQDFINAVGDRPHALDLLQQYAASELRRMALSRDGTINLRGLDAFQKAFGDRLQVFPELADRLSNLRGAQEFLDSETARVLGQKGVVDSLADGLRKSMPANGEWDSAAYQRWLRANGDRLAQYPEIRQFFSDANQAQQTLETTQKAAAWARQNFEASAIGKFLHTSDPSQTIGAILAKPDAVPQLQRMMIQLRGTEEGEAAINGLKSALAKHIVDRYATGADAFGTGENRLRGADLRKFFNQKRAALETVLGPEGTQTIENVVKDIERESSAIDRGRTTRGSDTAGNLQAIAKAEGKHSLFHWVASEAGAKLPWVEAIMGHPIMGLATAGLSTARMRAMAKVDALVARMVMDPEFAKVMFEKFPARPHAWQMRGLDNRLNTVARGSGLYVGAGVRSAATSHETQPQP